MAGNLKSKDIDVVILCGGKGRRLRALVNDRPKPLAEINGRPFLDILINYVAGFGFKRFILCIGYKAGIIRDYYRKKKYNIDIIFSEEKSPLGTAGAVKNAEAFIKSFPFLVLNGDSFCALDLNKFIDFHINKNAFASICLIRAGQGNDLGVVKLNSSGQVIKFDEKLSAKAGNFINGGIYLFSDKVLPIIPAKQRFSLEYDLFPRIIHKKFFGYETKKQLIDIGTPKRYKKAEEILRGQYASKA